MAANYAKLNQENQIIKTTHEDLKIRYDHKVDLVGKLSIKTFVLMTEVEKLYQING